MLGTYKKNARHNKAKVIIGKFALSDITTINSSILLSVFCSYFMFCFNKYKCLNSNKFWCVCEWMTTSNEYTRLKMYEIFNHNVNDAIFYYNVNDARLFILIPLMKFDIHPDHSDCFAVCHAIPKSNDLNITRAIPNVSNFVLRKEKCWNFTI